MQLSLTLFAQMIFLTWSYRFGSLGGRGARGSKVRTEVPEFVSHSLGLRVLFGV